MMSTPQREMHGTAIRSVAKRVSRLALANALNTIMQPTARTALTIEVIEPDSTVAQAHSVIEGTILNRLDLRQESTPPASPTAAEYPSEDGRA